MLIVPLPDLAATKDLAQRLAPIVKRGDVLALRGDLGAGKTTFARALISAVLGIDTDVPSPTYTLVQTYNGPDFPIFHFDLYRLESPEDLTELGWDETADGLTLVEWPERAGEALPTWRLDLTLSTDSNSSQATLEPRGEDWQTRLHGF